MDQPQPAQQTNPMFGGNAPMRFGSARGQPNTAKGQQGMSPLQQQIQTYRQNQQAVPGNPLQQGVQGNPLLQQNQMQRGISQLGAPPPSRGMYGQPSMMGTPK